jgi:hypothetical protein
MNPRRRPLFWRRHAPIAIYDIAKVRSKTLPRGKRFETVVDARNESVRSQALLKSGNGNTYALRLQDCRDNHYYCHQTYCPQCARIFRRYFTGQLLRLRALFLGEVRIIVVLLKAAPAGKLGTLEIEQHQHSLRKKLLRAGLAAVPAIGGFEMAYRAREKQWVLHANLVLFGGKKSAIDKFKRSFSKDELKRPTECVDLRDDTEQLSYVLKFTTYHRPFKQHGRRKPRAVPLNPILHLELIRWMSQYEFRDHLFLFNARRRGASIEFSSKVTRKA